MTNASRGRIPAPISATETGVHASTSPAASRSFSQATTTSLSSRSFATASSLPSRRTLRPPKRPHPRIHRAHRAEIRAVAPHAGQPLDHLVAILRGPRAVRLLDGLAHERRDRHTSTATLGREDARGFLVEVELGAAHW